MRAVKKRKKAKKNEIDVLQIRKTLGLSQQKLADKLGIDRRTIQNYETGGSIPKTKHAIFLSLLDEKKEESQADLTPELLAKQSNSELIRIIAEQQEIIADQQKIIKDSTSINKLLSELLDAERGNKKTSSRSTVGEPMKKAG